MISALVNKQLEWAMDEDQYLKYAPDSIPQSDQNSL